MKRPAPPVASPTEAEVDRAMGKAPPPDPPGTVRVTIDPNRCTSAFHRSLVNELRVLAGLQRNRAQSRRANDIVRKLARYGILTPAASAATTGPDREATQSPGAAALAEGVQETVG